MPLPIDMLFVRHGESVGNIASRTLRNHGDASHYDEDFLNSPTCRWELTERGHEQARLTGEWILNNFVSEEFGRYYVSPYDRAIQTAGGLLLPQAIWYVDDRFRERSHGDTEVVSPLEVGNIFEINMKAQSVSPYYAKHPNGESYAELVEGRIRAIFDTLIRECSDTTVVAVTHGDFMNAMQMAVERISSIEWQREKKVPHRKMWNCQVLHYTRRNPVTGEITGHPTHWRSLRAWKESGREKKIVPTEKVVSDWHVINRKAYSNDDLHTLLTLREES